MARRRLRTVKVTEGMYSMTTRKKQTKSLLQKFGDLVFDAGKHSGGSGRESGKAWKK